MLKLGSDGKSQTQLLADSSALLLVPSSCGTDYLVLRWLFHGGTNSDNIWRTNPDGSSPLKLTDGKSVAYVIWENGADNVWVQPLDGSAGHPITDFKSEQIWSFSLSPDGKSLAVLRGHYDSDVVLLQESK